MASWLKRFLTIGAIGTAAAGACVPEKTPATDDPGAEPDPSPRPSGGRRSTGGSAGKGTAGEGGMGGSSEGGAAGDAGAAQGETITEAFDGRDYRLYTPPSLEEGVKAPLVVVLHGALGNAEWIQDNLRLDAQADAYDFRVAYLNGTSTALGEDQRVWNAGNGCCGIAAREDVPDVAYVKEFIGMMETRDADAGQIAVVGQSNGGALVWRVACEAPEAAGSFVSISGTLMVDECQQSAGKYFLHIHGANDRNILFDGGSGPDGDPTINWRSVPDSQALLEAAGAEVVVVKVSGAGHSLQSFTDAAEQNHTPTLAERIADFLREKFRDISDMGQGGEHTLNTGPTTIDPKTTSASATPAPQVAI